MYSSSMFRRYSVACSLILMCNVQGVTAKQSNKCDVAGAVDALNQKVSNWNRHDLDGVISAYLQSTDTSLLSSNTAAWGFDALQKQYKKWYGSDHNAMGKIGFSDLKSRAIGDKHVLCTGNWFLDEPDQPHEQGVFSLVYEQTKDGWKILQEHLSTTK